MNLSNVISPCILILCNILSILLYFSFVDQYLIVRAAKDIAANEEIFSCYGKVRFD